MEKKPNIDEFGKVCRLLVNADVNDDMHQDRIYNRVRYKMQTGTIPKNNKKEDGIHMKRKIEKSIAIVAATFVCIIGVFSTTAFGQGIIQSIVENFKVGGMTITQYDKELPKIESSVKGDSNAVRDNTEQIVTIKEARAIMEINFEVPAWLPDGYKYQKCRLQGDKAVELVFSKDENLVSLLISKGENGISTTGEVKKETVADETVYFANGIVLWEQDGLTYELYQMGGQDFDLTILGKIISAMTTGTDYNDNIIYADEVKAQSTNDKFQSTKPTAASNDKKNSNQGSVEYSKETVFNAKGVICATKETWVDSVTHDRRKDFNDGTSLSSIYYLENGTKLENVGKSDRSNYLDGFNGTTATFSEASDYFKTYDNGFYQKDLFSAIKYNYEKAAWTDEGVVKAADGKELKKISRTYETQEGNFTDYVYLDQDTGLPVKSETFSKKNMDVIQYLSTFEYKTVTNDGNLFDTKEMKLKNETVTNFKEILSADFGM